MQETWVQSLGWEDPPEKGQATHSSNICFPGGSDGKASSCSVGDLGLIPGLGRSPGKGNGNSIQYCCLGNPMDRGAWQTTVLGVTKSWTRLRDFTFTFIANNNTVIVSGGQ